MRITFDAPDDHFRFSVPHGERYRVGRREQNDVVLSDLTVGSFHCQVDFRGERPVIRDLGSPSGVWVNDRGIGGVPTELGTGDRVRIGRLRFTVTVA